MTAVRDGRAADPAAGARSDGRRDWLLAIDTATTRAIVAAGTPDGTPLGITTWVVGRTHGEQLLPAIGRLHGEANLRRSRIRGVIVGTGPGAFTGLRVGIATAKALAHELGVPIVGISTGEALLVAAADSDGRAGPTDAAMTVTRVLLLPAGPNDRLVVRRGVPAVLLPGGAEPDLADREELIAVDLEGRAPADAVERGERAHDGLAQALVHLGAARLGAGDVDDLARLVPDYVSLPRGIRAETGEVAWSRDHR
jgi:tRNA threonylcarbamoyl adenosine modification protein YeaZ